MYIGNKNKGNGITVNLGFIFEIKANLKRWDKFIYHFIICMYRGGA